MRKLLHTLVYISAPSNESEQCHESIIDPAARTRSLSTFVESIIVNVPASKSVTSHSFIDERCLYDVVW